VSVVEAVLTYRPQGADRTSSPPIPLGTTDDPRVLRTLRDRLIETATSKAQMWADIDPGVAAIQKGELERMRSIFGVLLPDEDLKPDLRPVKGEEADDSIKSP
jgi:hypothetical protein